MKTLSSRINSLNSTFHSQNAKSTRLIKASDMQTCCKTIYNITPDDYIHEWGDICFEYIQDLLEKQDLNTVIRQYKLNGLIIIETTIPVSSTGVQTKRDSLQAIFGTQQVTNPYFNAYAIPGDNPGTAYHRLSIHMSYDNWKNNEYLAINYQPLNNTMSASELRLNILFIPVYATGFDKLK